MKLYADKLPKEARIKLDLNTNPLGLPKAIEKVKVTAKDVQRYSEPAELAELKQSLAQRAGIKDEQLMITCGADQAIEIVLTHLLNPKETIAVLAPTFSRFEIVAKRLCDANVVLFTDINEVPECKVVLVCTPNNPTTEEVDINCLEKAVRSNPDKMFVIDSVFADFGKNNVSELTRFSNVVVLKSLSKNFGLAGLRVGWVESQKENIALLRKGVSPFRVPLLNQKIALAALSDKKHVGKTIKFLDDEFRKIKNTLGDKAVRRSNVPFFMFLTEKPIAAREFLLNNSISVVDSTSFSGAKNGFLRIAIGTKDDNKALVAALKQWVE